MALQREFTQIGEGISREAELVLSEVMLRLPRCAAYFASIAHGLYGIRELRNMYVNTSCCFYPRLQIRISKERAKAISSH